ncbi:hypothetical protein [Micromonospora cremea]|uniref:hypothetical protein n=1 Tax=Micromonospora cremea TaxID=709881 RepID=UPI001180C327|nr:hypothetical protein [Micromonospora cremea]
MALLFGADPLRRPLLPLLLLTVAALTKNEGLVATAGVAVLVSLRARTDLRRAGLVWLPVLAGGGWAVLVRLLGARSDIADGSSSGVAPWEPEAVQRFHVVLAALWDTVGPVLAGAAVVALLGALFLRERRRAVGLASDGWVWAATACYLIVLVWTYLSGPNDIEWWLRTSVDRLSVLVVLLAVVSCAGWVAAAFGGDRRAEPDPAIDGPRDSVMAGATRGGG